MVAAEMATTAPLTIDVVFRLMSELIVPTSKSMTNVPPDVASRAHVAVPVAIALVDVIERVSAPAEAAPANVEPQENTARAVVVDPSVAGRGPLPFLPSFLSPWFLGIKKAPVVSRGFLRSTNGLGSSARERDSEIG
jgi:hypothetical protein